MYVKSRPSQGEIPAHNHRRVIRVLSYRVMLDVPVQLALFVARLLAAHRREIDTRRGTRAPGLRQALQRPGRKDFPT
jgi:hypothetical protein